MLNAASKSMPRDREAIAVSPALPNPTRARSSERDDVEVIAFVEGPDGYRI